MTDRPRISVIVATYNRSQVLKHAVQSVLGSTLRDWELIVVGDCCTDDTAEVVAAFSDPRIRFFNLSTNSGDQSGPENAGLERARGDYVAFLNRTVSGGGRPNSYLRRGSIEHDFFAREMQRNGGFREHVLETAALHAARRNRNPTLRTAVSRGLAPLSRPIERRGSG